MNPDINEIPCRVLVVDDDQRILDEFRDAFAENSSQEDAATDTMGELEAELFGCATERATTPHFDIVTCTQGEQAVAAVANAHKERRPFEIVFLDVRMPPGIDGVKAAKAIRKIDKSLTIIFVTAYSDSGVGDIKREVPPPDKVQYFTKPFKAMDFVRLAGELCTH